MELKPELTATLVSLGLTPEEIETFKIKLAETTGAIDGRLASLNSQITTLSAQRDDAQIELDQAMVTVNKLIV